VARQATLIQLPGPFLDHLLQARFTRKPLNPDVDNLDLVFFKAAAGTASAELVQQWVRQLERELARGR
jgi:hypothetical protein